MADQPFNVYCAGETLTGTDISMRYVWITQMFVSENGQIRLTNEEARNFGEHLIRAADFNEEPDPE